MAKILGIIASPRHLGNTELLVKAAAKAAGGEHELELLRLDEFRLEKCKGCYKCTMGDKKCVLDDDLEFIIEKILEADGIIIGTPTYVRGLSASLKLLGERVIAIAQHLDEYYRKPCVVMVSYGPKGDEGYAYASTLALVRMMGLDVKDACEFLGSMPGEVFATEGNEERAARLGRALFGERRKAVPGECPYCWSDVWKLKKPGVAVCPMCALEAKIKEVDGKIQYEYGETPTHVFEYGWLNTHFCSDLSAGVADFKEKKTVLREIRGRYKSDDEVWLKPEKGGE